MRYYNQLLHRDIPYETNLDNGGNPENKRTIASSGCGVCSICMAVELLTDKEFPIVAGRDLAYESGANRPHPGTNLDILGPVVAERFDLTYRGTNDLDEVKAALQRGGQVVTRVNKGLFTLGSHYILITAYDGADFCILDPSYKEGKFDTPERAGKVDDSHAPYLYCNAELVHAETPPNRTRYHIFQRKRKTQQQENSLC